MREPLTIGLLILDLWWLGLSGLCLRDYVKRRRETKAKPPLTAAEKAEIAQIEAELPRKDPRPLTWYVTHPREGLRLSLHRVYIIPLIVIFLPMLAMIRFLPNPNRR